ncbi:Acyltransferase family protein [compost metagenome]
MFEQGKVDGFTLYLLLPTLGLWFLGFALLYARPQQRAATRVGMAFRRALEALGHWSYGIYLLHMPVLYLIEHTGLLAVSEMAASAVALLVVLLASALSYRFVEKPLMKWRTPPVRAVLCEAAR